MIRLPVLATVPNQPEVGVDVPLDCPGWLVFSSDEPVNCEGFGSPDHVGGSLVRDYLITIDDYGVDIATCLACTAAAIRDGGISDIVPRVP